MAAGRRDLLYGLGRNLWDRRHRAWRRIWQSDSHPAIDPASLEPADRVHDWRAFERAALRRRLLRLGAPRYGEFLGISGSLAVAGSVHFRYGDLSHAVCRVPDAHVSVVSGEPSRRARGAGRGGRLRSSQYCRREGCFDDFAVAVLPVVGAVCGYFCAGAVQDSRAGECGDQADYFEREHFRRPAHLHVELHGMGQRFDHRHRSGASATHLSSGHAGGGGHRLPELCSSVCRNVDHRAFRPAHGKRARGPTSRS